MSILIVCLYVVEVIVCLLLALVVMLQKPKEGGLGGVIGGGMAEAAFGADAGNVLIKATVWLGVIFLVNTLALARFTSTSSNKTGMDDLETPATAPAVPQMPAGAIPAPAPAPAAAPVAPAPKAPAAPAAPKAPAAAPAAPKAPAAPAAPAPKAPAAPAK